MTPRSLRRTIVAVIIALTVAMGLWWGLWSLAARQFYSSLDQWIVSGRAAGYTISYDDRQAFGFPHRVVLRFTNVVWKDPEGIAFHAEQMDISSLPWDTRVFGARFRGRAQIDVPLDADGRSLTLSGANGTARVMLNEDGIWTFSHIKLLDAQLGRAPDVLFSADRLEATAERPIVPPKDHSTAGLKLTGEAESVTLPVTMPSPFGQKMASIDVSLRVMDAVPDFRRKESVAAWNNASGVVEFDKLNMNWGQLRMEAKGTLGFDDDLQPEGAFSGSIGNEREVLGALIKEGFIPQHQAAILNSALTLFAKPAGDKKEIEVPVTIQLGGLFLGPVRIFMFPEIHWPEAGTPELGAMPPPSP